MLLWLASGGKGASHGLAVVTDEISPDLGDAVRIGTELG